MGNQNKTKLISINFQMVTSINQAAPHNWVTKSTTYLALPRAAKHEIMWQQITADSSSGNWHSYQHFEVEPRACFDEQGDEFDCRKKTFHGVGNVAKATWVSLGDHPYTGMFRGGDTGFVRLSSTFEVDNANQHMAPGIGIKFLRDGIDSANIIAEFCMDGQDSLNFFEHSLSDYATFTQDGAKEAQPVFPWKLRFEPVASYANPIEDPATFDLQETFKQMPAGQTLYRVYAMDKPVQLGGTEQLIGEINMDTQLVTSQWADEYMFFKH